jgi:hypothetical protein
MISERMLISRRAFQEAVDPQRRRVRPLAYSPANTLQPMAPERKYATARNRTVGREILAEENTTNLDHRAAQAADKALAHGPAADLTRRQLDAAEADWRRYLRSRQSADDAPHRRRPL